MPEETFCRSLQSFSPAEEQTDAIHIPYIIYHVPRARCMTVAASRTHSWRSKCLENCPGYPWGSLEWGGSNDLLAPLAYRATLLRLGRVYARSKFKFKSISRPSDSVFCFRVYLARARLERRTSKDGFHEIWLANRRMKPEQTIKNRLERSAGAGKKVSSVKLNQFHHKWVRHRPSIYAVQQDILANGIKKWSILFSILPSGQMIYLVLTTDESVLIQYSFFCALFRAIFRDISANRRKLLHPAKFFNKC